MTKLTITGNTTPTVGIIETYALSVFDHSAPPNVFQPNLSKKAEWYIEILEKGIWKKSKGDHKVGDAVTFRFSQRSLSRKAIKIVVKRGEDKGELLIKPQRSKEAKITRVELLDENYQPIPKGKILNYHDTLIARAHCVEMFWNYISFTLWEDDAKGEGHDPVINMMNKINPIPLRGEVNEKGIAEVTFRLPFYTMAVQIANAHTATGETDEGPTHEYYVTAELVSKHIMKASPNVNVANPTYIPPAPPSKTSSNTPEEKPQKPKPKADTPKFKISSNGKKQADPDAKILNAEFLNQRGQPIEKAEVGDTVIIKITTQNMKGRNVTVRIWEEETGYKTYDKIYEKKWVLPGNENFIKVPITKRIYELGITPEDFKNEKYDYKFQVYFIEIEPDNTHVTSQVIPISKTAPKLEVENSPSVAIIKKPREKEDKYKCPRCKKLTEQELSSVFPNAKDSKIIAEIVTVFNEYCDKFNVNTCTLKAHFFAQAKQESGDSLLPAMNGESMDYSIKGLLYTGFKNVSSKYLFGNKNGIEKAKDLGRKDNEGSLNIDKQIKIANFVYGLDPKAKTLGNKAPSDNQSLSEIDNEGWRYRGRGMLQITGKNNYTDIENHVNKILGKQVLNIKSGRKYDGKFSATEALLSGLGDWDFHKMYVPAKISVTEVACLNVIKIINSATKSKTKRVANLIGGKWYVDDDTSKKAHVIEEKNSTKSIFRVNECTLNNSKQAENSTPSKVIIKFGKNADKSVVSEKSLDILREVGEITKNYTLIITSTARDPYNQARVMYENIIKKGMKEQRKTYKEPGQRILDVYETAKANGKNKESIIKEMEIKIKEVGAAKVSRHCGDPKIINVFDVSQGMSNPQDFKRTISSKIKTLLDENNCYHLEIIQ